MLATKHSFHFPQYHILEETKDVLYSVPEMEVYFTKSQCKKKVITIVGNAGSGIRQGLVSLFFGSKGDIVVLGRTLKEIAVDGALKFADLLPEDDWLVFVPADILIYSLDSQSLIEFSQVVEGAEIIILGVPNQKELADPPFPSIFAVRRRFLPELQNEMCECLIHARITLQGLNQLNKAMWWSLLLRPALLNQTQWTVASGNDDFDSCTWWKLWEYAQQFAKRIHLCTLPLKTKSKNVNTNRDLYSIYQCVLGRPIESYDTDAINMRKFFKLPLRNYINVMLSGHISLSRHCLLRESEISVKKGLNLVVGNGVVIDNSKLCVTKSSGSDIVIPDETVIAHCNISGKLSGNAPNGVLIGVCSDTGVRFVAESLQTTICFENGKKLTGIVPFTCSPKASMECNVSGLEGLSWKEVFATVKRPQQIAKEVVQ